MAESIIQSNPVKYFNIPANSGNWNNFNQTGFYSTYNAANSPKTNTWIAGIVVVMANNSAFPTQLAFGGGEIYTRQNVGEGWSGWSKI